MDPRVCSGESPGWMLDHNEDVLEERASNNQQPGGTAAGNPTEGVGRGSQRGPQRPHRERVSGKHSQWMSLSQVLLI